MAAAKKMLGIIALPILLISLGLGVYAITQAHELWLPVPDLSLALVILLPIVSFLSFMLPDETNGRQAITLPGSGNTRPRFPRNFAWIFNILPSSYQMNRLITLLAVLLITLSASDLARTDISSCLLEKRWRDLFDARDERAVKGIQDSLICCGYINPSTLAWPFQDKDHGPEACAEMYKGERGRERGCKAKLIGKLHNVNGSMTGAAVAILVAQFLVLYFTRISHSREKQRTYHTLARDRIVEEEEDEGHPPERVRFLDSAPGENAEGSGDREGQRSSGRGNEAVAV